MTGTFERGNGRGGSWSIGLLPSRKESFKMLLNEREDGYGNKVG